MRVFLSIVLIAWTVDSGYAANLIRSSIGVFDPNPYVGKKQELNQPGAHSRHKRSSDFTASEEQAILDEHNELRSGVSPEASDMEFMVWDEDLATLAQQWSDMCIWDHGTPETNISTFSPYGQNLWLGGGTADNQPDGIGATQAWYNEVDLYTYDTRDCSGVCGHYTQVVWGDSYALGCGLTFCETTHDGHEDVWLITCHYGPAGNYNRHPYLSGTSCTKCSSGSGQCYNNSCRLCSDHNEECICNQQCQNCGTLNSTSCRCDCPQGFIEDDCSAVCEDTSGYCNAGWYYGQCSGYDYVRDGCPLMCQLCTAAPEDFECDSSQGDDVSTSGGTTHAPAPITTSSISGQEHTTEDETNECEVECQNDGTIDINTCACACPSGYQGDTCEEDETNECEVECQNDGTIDINTCACACPSGYQGDTCEENQEQVSNGVQITIETSISTWDDAFESALVGIIENVIDDYCNIATNYGTCCPNSGNRMGEGTLNYVDTDDVFIADGFPKQVDSASFHVMIYVIPETNNDLCEAGSSFVANRKRRDVNRLIQRRVKRATTLYLDQEALYTAIADNVDDIATAIGVPVGEVVRGKVDVEEQEQNDGVSDGVIAAIIIGVIAVIVFAIGVTYLLFKDKNRGRVATSNGSLPNGK